MKVQIKHFVRVLLSELERGIFSLPFMLSVLGTAAVLFAGSTALWFPGGESLEQGLKYQYYLSVLEAGIKSEAFVFCLPLLAAFPAGVSVLSEMSCGLLKGYLPRCGRGTYLGCKVILAVVCGGGGVACGYLAAAGMMSLIYRPMENVGGKESVSALPECFLQAAVVFLAGAFFSMLSAMLGLIFRSRYMALGGAFLVSYLLIIFTSRYLPAIYVINPREWFLQKHYWEGDVLGCIGFLAELCVLMALLYGQLLYRKISPQKGGYV